ncbi:MAG: hypothetical protein RBT62_04505 [Spirochaetia bacterium]|nr:hypothetical protein [Spirochaetia bacterium]
MPHPLSAFFVIGAILAAIGVALADSIRRCGGADGIGGRND